MELKDVILSTLAELEEVSPAKEETDSLNVNHQEEPAQALSQESLSQQSSLKHHIPVDMRSDEVRMLEGIRERLLVLFEGFQSPNNVQLEAKIDLTLNFLEYLLAMIDNRLDSLKEDG